MGRVGGFASAFGRFPGRFWCSWRIADGFRPRRSAGGWREGDGAAQIEGQDAEGDVHEMAREGETACSDETTRAFQGAEHPFDPRAHGPHHEVHAPLPAGEAAASRIVGDHRGDTPRLERRAQISGIVRRIGPQVPHILRRHRLRHAAIVAGCRREGDPAHDPGVLVHRRMALVAQDGISPVRCRPVAAGSTAVPSLRRLFEDTALRSRGASTVLPRRITKPRARSRRSTSPSSLSASPRFQSSSRAAGDAQASKRQSVFRSRVFPVSPMPRKHRKRRSFQRSRAAFGSERFHHA